MDAHPGGSSSSPELHPTLLSNMYRNAPFGIPPLKDPLPLKSDGQPDFTQRLIKNVHQPPRPPSDEDFWLPDTFPRCPDAAFLRRHFHREGRLQEHQALWILEEGRRLMKEEPNVLEVEAPVTIVGDIHGQFYDLMTLMKPAIGGSPSTTRYLFLGDYVDRGCFGIECLLFLLALKICHQDNYLLLRGNHESQHLTNYFTFRLECQKKYSEAVYNASVLAFQAMPLAAIVNNQFFCVHGGLSPELQTIDDLQKVHRICEPGSSGMVCDILWADPAKNWKAGGPPFQTNPTRGCSYIYGYEAVKMFLDRNHLKLMIRAHEAQAHGFMRHDIPGVAPHLMTIFSAPNYCDVHGNLGAILKYDGKAISVRQFNHVEHPFWLPNFQDVFAWSLPFVAEKAVEMLNSLLDVYPDAEFSEYSTSPQSSLITPPMDLDEDTVVGVVPNTHRRKGHFTALQEGGTKLAEVYKLLREQSEDVGEIRLPVPDTAEEEGRQRRRRNTLEVWGGGNLDMGTWNYDQIREQDLINERMPPPLIDHAAKTYYIDNEVRPAPPTPDSPRHFTLGSLTDSPSSNMRALTLSDTPYSSFAYDSTAGYEAGSSIRSPSPRRGTMVLGPTTGTTYTSSPSMRKRSVEDMDALMRQISNEVLRLGGIGPALQMGRSGRRNRAHSDNHTRNDNEANPSPDRWTAPSRLLGSWTAPHPSLLVVVVVVPIGDLNGDRSLRAMSFIADHVVRGASNTPLQCRQPTTTPEGTSRHSVVVTRAYELYPAMVNPLAFVHQQSQCSLHSQSPPNLQSGGLSPEPNNRCDNNQPHCMLEKSQDLPRTITKLPTAQSMLSSARPTTPLSLNIPDRCPTERIVISNTKSTSQTDEFDESVVKEPFTASSPITPSTPLVLYPPSPQSSISFDFSPIRHATAIPIPDRSRTPQLQRSTSANSDASFHSFVTGITSPASENRVFPSPGASPKGKGKGKAPIGVDEGRSLSPIAPVPWTNFSSRAPSQIHLPSSNASYRAFDWAEFERSLTAPPRAGPSSLVSNTITLGVFESALGLGLEGLVSSPKGERQSELEDDERTEYYHAHLRVPTEPRGVNLTTITDPPSANLATQPTSSAAVPIPLHDRISSRTQSFLSINKTSPGGGGGKLRKKAAPTLTARNNPRLNNASEPHTSHSEAEKEKKRKSLHLPLPRWLVKVKDTKATPHVALDTDTLVFGRGRGQSRNRQGSKPHGYTEPYPLTFPPDCEWLFYPASPGLTFYDANQVEEGETSANGGCEVDWFGTVLPFEMRVQVLRALLGSYEDDHRRRAESEGDGWNVVVASRESERWVGRVKGMRALVRLSRISKAWQDLCFDGQLWADLPLATFGSPTPLSPSQLLRITRSVGSFAQILNLQGFNALQPAEVVDITSALSLCLDLDISHTPEPGATQLREVNLRGCRSLTSNTLHYLLRRCPELEVLKLAGLDCVVDTTLTEALSSATRLVHLDVGRCANLPGRAIARFANAHRSRLLSGKSVPLKVLKMSGLKHVTKATLSVIAQVFPALEVLDVSWCLGVNDAALRVLVEWEHGEPWTQWHEPIVLTSREAGFDPGDTTKYTRRRSKLRHLILSGCKNITDSGVGALAYCMPELEFLELASLGSALRDEGLVRLLRTTLGIRKLDLEDATELTDAVLEHLTPAPPPPVRKGQRPDPQPGENLEHFVISSVQEVSPEAMCRLIKGCKNLRVFEADNTRVSSAVVREFVNRRRAREKRERSTSSGSEVEGGATVTGGSEIVAIDSRWVSDTTIRELTNVTRPRRGFRGWEARDMAYEDSAAINMPIEEGGGGIMGQDECDETRVVVKTFQTWSNIDSVAQQREKRIAGHKKLHPHKEGKSVNPLWRRTDEEGEERGGCVIM